MRKVVIAVSMAAAHMIPAATPFAAASGVDASAEALKIGEREYFTKCFSCHSLEQGGAHKIGPNLWGVFGAKAGSRAGFTYSPALKKSGITWSAKTMDQWLASPATFVPGNQMAYAGLPNEQDRKALVAYLQKMTSAK